MKAQSMLLTALLAVSMVSVSAWAAGPQSGNPPPRPAFSDFDTDNDGYITSQELSAFQSKRMQERAENGGRMQYAGMRPELSDIDTDGDNLISEEEFLSHQMMGPRGPGRGNKSNW
ncbi:EF-hand domain-containing protein [Photobacterium gaetbulicola]|uniref:Putative calcium-binding EF-hand-containing protein n=1 Tax=Photobacterium gaetbulicola Gung47 TaxID=658445 RepID=A0A0C5WJP4_9GAMM|nr:EF-hand domain-containing protein [Photobacterium gaetbulicola]AJR06437.1 putative calcium-binding EF-hand-containing protein [Photobacterium gaetbulicola Gung47]PSU05529.1 EF-hand domain-containing protein [Photobacterium gaetbulicola]